MDKQPMTGTKLAGGILAVIFGVWFMVTLLNAKGEVQTQALASVIGNALGILGAFAIAWWSLSTKQRKEASENAKLASMILKLIGPRMARLARWANAIKHKSAQDFEGGRSIWPLRLAGVVAVPDGSRSRIGEQFPDVEFSVSACDQASESAVDIIDRIKPPDYSAIDGGAEDKKRNLLNAQIALRRVRTGVVMLRGACLGIEDALDKSADKVRLQRILSGLEKANQVVDDAADRIEAYRKSAKKLRGQTGTAQTVPTSLGPAPQRPQPL